MTNDGLLIVFSGPSGAGKDTVLKKLLESDPNLRLSVSATTRMPRPGEIDGTHYHFLSEASFQELITKDQVLEYAQYCGNFYGTPLAPIQKWNEMGNDVILEIEIQGGAQVMRKRPDCVGIFILPPSLEVLEHRLRKRGTESEEAIQKRLAAAKDEIQKAADYDYVVINDDLADAVQAVAEIIHAEKRKTTRNQNLIERMIAPC